MKYITFSLFWTYILYISITILPPLLIHIAKRIKYKKSMWVLAWFVLTIPVAIRYETGVDWTVYEYAYNNIVRYGGNFLQASFNIEITFKLFTLISHKLVGNSIILFSLYAALTNLFALIGIYRYRNSVNTVWAMYVYTSLLYFTQYNLGRQFLAMMIIFAGTKEIVERKFIRYAIWVAVASLFHTTAILMILLYFYGIAIGSNNKYRKVINALYYAGSVTILLLLNQLTALVSIILNNSKYESYVSTGNYELGRGILLQAFMLVLMFSSYYINRCKLADNEALLNYSMRTFVLGNVMYLLQYVMTNYGGRISLYLMPIEILLFGQMMDGLKLKKGKIYGSILSIIILLFFFARAIYTITSNAQGHVPYSCYIF